MKAILLTDMPDNCNDCTFRTGDNRGNYWCHALLPRLKLGHIDGVIPRHISCPLKPLPHTLDELDLEVWGSNKGKILAPIGLFDELIGEKE